MKRGRINARHTGLIAAGTNRSQYIEDVLANADVVLILFSPDLTSGPKYESEVLKAMEPRADKHVRVIPIMVRPTDVKDLQEYYLRDFVGKKPVLNWLLVRSSPQGHLLWLVS